MNRSYSEELRGCPRTLNVIKGSAPAPLTYEPPAAAVEKVITDALGLEP